MAVASLLSFSVSSVYNTTGHMIDAPEFLSGTYIGTLLLLMHIE